jgi:hypothetical protein
MADNKIDEAYIELRVDGLDVVKNALEQARIASEKLNSSFSETQEVIDGMTSKNLNFPKTPQIPEPKPLPPVPPVPPNNPPNEESLRKLDLIKQKLKEMPVYGEQLDSIIDGTGRRISALDLSNIDALREGLINASLGGKELLKSYNYDETNDNALRFLGILRRIDSLARNAASKSSKSQFDPFEGQQEFGFPRPPQPPGPPSAGDRAAEFVENLNRRNEERIEMIRELTALYDDMARKESAVANATKDRIDALQQEHRAYNEGRYGESQQMIAGLIDAEKKRIEKISELKMLQEGLVVTDTRAAAAVKKKIEALEKEQKAYESGGRGMLGNIMANIQDKTANFREKVGTLRGAVAGPTGEGIRGAMGGGLSGITQLLTRTMGPALATASAGLAAVASVVAPVAAGMAALKGVLIAAPAAFVGAAYAISKFTDSVNPGLTIQLNMVMRDLTAIIGTALNPVLQAMVPAIRDFANRLLPVTRDMAQYFSGLMGYMGPVMTAFNSMYQQIVGTLSPVFKLLTDIFGVLAQVVGALMEVIAGILIPFKVVFEAIYEVLRPLIEAFRVIGDLLVNAGKGFRLIMAGLEGFIKGIASFLGFGDIINASVDGWKSIGSALKSFQNWLILAAASVAKFFGMTSFVTGMINSLKPPDSTGISAAQNPQYQSIESLGKNMSLQAAIATAGAGGESEQQKQDRQMLEQLVAIQANGPTLVDAINGLPTRIADAIANGAKRTADAAKSAITQGVGDATGFNLGYEGARLASESARGSFLDTQLAAMNKRNAARFVQG